MSISTLRAKHHVPPPPKAAAPSLPPEPGEALSPTPSLTAKPVPKAYRIEKDSIMHKKAIAIVAMRAGGYTTDEIAAELHIKPASVSSYIYKATKAGWLVNRKGESILNDPADRITYELAHKAVRNLNEFLDSADDDTRKEVTLELAKGTLWKRFDTPAQQAPPSMQMLQVKIEMPSTNVAIRQDTVGGVPRSFIDGEVDDEG